MVSWEDCERTVSARVQVMDADGFESTAHTRVALVAPRSAAWSAGKTINFGPSARKKNETVSDDSQWREYISHSYRRMLSVGATWLQHMSCDQMELATGDRDRRFRETGNRFTGIKISVFFSCKRAEDWCEYRSDEQTGNTFKEKWLKKFGFCRVDEASTLHWSNCFKFQCDLSIWQRIPEMLTHTSSEQWYPSF